MKRQLVVFGGVLTVIAMGAAQKSVMAQAAPAQATSARKWTAPRMPWGDPDLQGTFTSDNSINVPFERPTQFGERPLLTEEEYAAREQENSKWIADAESERPAVPFAQDPANNNSPRHWLERGNTPSRQTSLVVDPPNGRIPPRTPEGEKRIAARQALRKSRGPADSWEDRSNYDRCISRGVAGSVLPVIYGNGTSIFQAPGFVVIRNEMIHEARVIPLESRPRVGQAVHMFMGDPRGHWEGDTLVVESTNFTDRTGIGGNGNGAIHSEQLRLVERFTRVAPDAIRYGFTVDDPQTYTRSWKVGLDLTSKPGYEIYEYACHEGNYGLRNMLSAARFEERAAAEAGKR